MLMLKDELCVSKSMHVLVVDDDEAIREILNEAIESFNYRCSVAENAKDAIRMMEENDDITIAICDILMPSINGIELCNIIKKKGNIDVILMTGNLEAYSYTEAIKEGATDFITKPFSIKELQK